MENWDAHVESESRRFRDGLERLPQDPDPRQKQLVRMANAAAGAGLACLMAERADEARSWFLEAAARYRESHADAPSGSWGRPIGSVKMRLLGGDVAGAVEDARWTLSLAPARSESPIGRYAAVLASLVLGDDDTAAELVGTLRAETEDRFPRPVADALAGLAARDAATYEDGVRRTLHSFEARAEFLEDVPVADTVLVLEALARTRGLETALSSALLPAPAGSDPLR